MSSLRGRRPVLYLDVDDTLLRYANGREADPVEAPGASTFLEWAVGRFEVRWLTQWCRAGHMGDAQISVLERILDVDPELLRGIRGLDWRGSESKLDGIAWLDHLVLERPFLWIEDDYGLGDLERRFLRENGFEGCWLRCNVTEEEGALEALHRDLRRRADGDRPPVSRRSRSR